MIMYSNAPDIEKQTVLCLRQTSKQFATYNIPVTSVSHNSDARLAYLDLVEAAGLRVVSASNHALTPLSIDVRWDYPGSPYESADALPRLLQLPMCDEA